MTANRPKTMNTTSNFSNSNTSYSRSSPEAEVGYDASVADDDARLPIPREVAFAGAIIGSAIIVLGIVGNGLIITTVIIRRPICKACDVFIVSLAVWDLLETVCVRPLYVHTYLVGDWRFGENVCLYVLCAANLTVLESILHIVTIALYRYVIFVHPLRARCLLRMRNIVLALGILYLGPLAMVLGPTLSKARKEEVVFNRRIMFCSFVKHQEFRLSGVVKKLIFLGLAGSFMLFFYVRIVQRVRQSRRIIDVQGGCSASRVRQELMLLKTVMTVFISFLITYLPLSLVYGLDRHRVCPYYVYFIGVALLWSSSSINWLIYGCVNKHYGDSYRYLLCRLCRGRRPGKANSLVKTCDNALRLRRPGSSIKSPAVSQVKQSGVASGESERVIQPI